jgi:hypothetical protein
LIARSILFWLIVSLAWAPGAFMPQRKHQRRPDSCGQLLADAEARFLSTLAPDGSVPASPETEAAAQQYIWVSKLCYEELEAQSLAGDAHEGTPTFIDDGGVIMESESSAEFTTTGHKWGSGSWGTSGGTVTYSFMGNGLDLSAENNATYGSSVAISSLPGFQACFITEIRNAFAAWQAVSDIRFVQVTDSGSAFNAPGAVGDIRIGAHTFDGPSGVLAHAYYPPPNGSSAAGDMHFDRQENWTCNTSGIDIGVVALHEIGHSLGLGHENDTLAVMNSYYNPGLAGLQSDDVNGAAAIYGSAQLLAPPSNDNFANAKTISSIPYNDSLSTAEATVEDQEVDSIACAGNSLRGGIHTVWYKHTPGTSGPLTFSTAGSSYDTYIAVWTGSALNNLTLVGCNDDVQSGLTSQLSINSTAGVTYFVQVAEYNGYVGDAGNDPECDPCNLSFSVNNQPIQTFADVPPTHPYYQYIEALYAAGLTAGCATNPLRYCPSTAMDRAQSAVFMMRGSYGSSYVPPAGLTYLFQDNWSPGTWARPWAEAMRSTNLTTGCQPSRCYTVRGCRCPGSRW